MAAAYQNRGVLYEGQDKPELALADYAKAIELNPNLLAAYAARSDLLIKQGDYANALDDLNKVIELEPRYGKAYVERGRIYMQRQAFEEAMSDFTNCQGKKGKQNQGERKSAIRRAKARCVPNESEVIRVVVGPKALHEKS